MARRMTQAERRALVLSAVRGELRHRGMAPETLNAVEAHKVLDDLARRVPDLLVSHWYRTVSPTHMSAFYRAWERWRQHGKV